MISNRDKLLKLIEFISLENIDSGDAITKTEALETIYKACHILQGGCEVHKDWEKELLILWELLDKENLI